MSRVVVVGAGLGGLATAARLQARGHEVTVCEQAPQVGGKLGRRTRDGFTFDTGPSLVTMPQVLEALFADTGAPLSEALELRAVDPAFDVRFADGSRLEVPGIGGVDAVSGAVEAALGGRAGEDWARLMRRGEAMWRATYGPFLASPLTGRDLLRQAWRLRDVATIAPWLSLRDLGTRTLQDARLRTLLDRYATYTGSDPRRAPATLAVVPYAEQAFGAWYVPGGLRRIATAVSDRATALGATVRTGADVEAVLLRGGRAAGVRLADGEELPADVVVANADAAHLHADLLPAGAARRDRRRLARATPSLSGFVLLLGLSGRTPGLRHHTVAFPADYDDEFDSVFGGRSHPTRPVPDPTVYVAAPDDPALRPDEDTEAWFVLVNAPRHDPDQGVDWAAPGLEERYGERVLDVMAARGLDVRDRVRLLEVRTPADLEAETRSPGGSIYGSSSNGVRAAFLRPANRSSLPGLFLVGGSAHPGGGLPLVLLSAAIVSELVGPA